MKKLWLFPGLVLLTVWMLSCSKERQDCNCPATLPDELEQTIVDPAVKGWELYSWPEDKEGCRKWKYVLLPGTDRLKSYSEVTNGSGLQVAGESQLKLLLNKFPANGNILWIGEKWLSNMWGRNGLYYGSLKLPSAALQNEVQQHCLQRNLVLAITP